MKPRLFVGSSTEKLDIAYAIQQSLDHDAQVTVWTQSVFQLNKSSLDSLIESLSHFDFAVFVFHPDDSTQIRGTSFDTVRDNIILELGLFIGRLGKDRVFFLVPRSVQSLHLPTDLLGIRPGDYDNKRQDGNLVASIGPFCNEIRIHLKEFIYSNLEGLQNEPRYIKEIVIKRMIGWEYELSAELLKYQMVDINQKYTEVLSNSAIRRFKMTTGMEFFQWFRGYINILPKYVPLFLKCLEEMNASFGPAGIAGNPIEIKNAVARIVLLCRELLDLELELYSINPPEELEHVKEKLKGLTKHAFINEVNRLPKETLNIVTCLRENRTNDITGDITLLLTVPDNLDTLTEDFRMYLENEGLL